MEAVLAFSEYALALCVAGTAPYELALQSPRLKETAASHAVR